MMGPMNQTVIRALQMCDSSSYMNAVLNNNLYFIDLILNLLEK